MLGQESVEGALEKQMRTRSAIYVTQESKLEVAETDEHRSSFCFPKKNDLNDNNTFDKELVSFIN